MEKKDLFIKKEKKYVIYHNDLKFKTLRNLDPEKIEWNSKEIEKLYYNENLDTIDYRLKECETNNYEYFDLSHLNLKKMPEINKNIKKRIKYLFLNNNELENIGDLRDYENLEVLDISNNNITYIHYLPSKLMELCCKYNNVTEIQNLEYLKILDCSMNKLKNLGHYPELEILFCSNNKISSIPNFTKLKKIICNNNNIREIQIYNNLVYLECSNNPIIKIDKSPHILDLICRNTQIKKLPTCLNNLKYLEIFENKIEILEHYPKLKELYCDIDGIKNISEKYVIHNYKQYDNKYMILLFK